MTVLLKITKIANCKKKKKKVFLTFFPSCLQVPSFYGAAACAAAASSCTTISVVAPWQPLINHIPPKENLSDKYTPRKPDGGNLVVIACFLYTRVCVFVHVCVCLCVDVSHITLSVETSILLSVHWRVGK